MRVDRADIAAAALIGGTAIVFAVHAGPDASWDLRNYHIYNPFALLHKAPGVDLLPAQMQGFLPPAPDLPGYWLRNWMTKTPNRLDAVLALPTAVAAIFAYLIARLLLPAPRGWPLAIGAALMGMTGAAGLPTIATSASEMPAGCLFLAGLYLLLRGLGRPGWRPCLLAGALFGVAVAIKLTIVPFVIGAAAAFVLCAGGPVRLRALALVSLGLGGALGGAAAGGAWWLHLYWVTENPIFPYFNNVFRSPLTAPIGMTDDRFLPHTTWQTLFYPFVWGFQKTRLVTELVMRDPRVALASLAVTVFAWRAVDRRRVDRLGACLALTLLIGFVLWQRQFSILRYLAPLEMLTGVALLLPLRPLIGRRRTVALLLAGGLGVFLALFTRYPDWGRAVPRDRAISVVMPAIPSGSMVLLLTNDPLGYTAAFADPAIRFVGVNNNLVVPGDTSQLGRMVEAAVRGHTGPLEGIEVAGSTRSAAVLDYYGLEKAGDCLPILSNLDYSSLRLCPLKRR